MAERVLHHRRAVAALAQDFLYRSTSPCVRVVRLFQCETPPTVFVDVPTRDQRLLKLQQQENNLFGRKKEALLFAFVPKSALKDPTRLINVVASINSTVAHVETTTVNTAVTLTADTRCKCAHLFYHRQYKEYHIKLMLRVTNAEARCVRAFMMWVNGQRYGTSSIVEAMASQTPTRPSMVQTALQCFQLPIKAFVGNSYEPIEKIDREVSGQDLLVEQTADDGDDYGGTHVHYLTQQRSLVLGSDHGEFVSAESAIAVRTLQEAESIVERYQAQDRTVDPAEFERLGFEIEHLRKKQHVRLWNIDYMQGVSEKMTTRLQEVKERLEGQYIVCSQLSALVLYILGRSNNLEMAMASNAQAVYDTLTACKEMSDDVYRVSEYEPPLSACIFSTAMPGELQ